MLVRGNFSKSVYGFQVTEIWDRGDMTKNERLAHIENIPILNEKYAAKVR